MNKSQFLKALRETPRDWRVDRDDYIRRGAKPCVNGSPANCDWPQARDD